LKKAVISGLRDKAREIAASELSLREPLELVNFEIIPALTEVGERFESGRAYLPELLMSAEAANAAFDEVKKKMPPKNDAAKEKIVLATVKGDIHDIGKNIVKTLLESYGFSVIDLGRDVPCEAVLEATLESGASLVGLSSLMTTTVGAMEETIALLKSKTDVKVMVGGAVLTPEYAEKIHADYYASDAMEGVKIAQEVFKKK
jgi:5-methyltetrahydrofolate--homocysteine methyltransferase